MCAKTNLFIILSILVFIECKRLTQVIILSRHNIRAPLMANLEHFSPNPWPVWTYKPGFLTTKGALLEESMGAYISDWLNENELLEKGCPADDDIHIYANTRHRTRESAKAFARGAFRNCSVKVHVINSNDMDPIFNPVIHNTSNEIKNEIIGEMQKQLDNLQLRDIYLQLEDIVDLKNSSFCTNENICSFANTKDVIFYEIGEEPNIIGPLAYCNSIVDSFIMSFYENMPPQNVAWGKIKTPKLWKSLTEITKENQNVRFNSTVLAKDVSKPLIDYITSLLTKDKQPKFTLLQGHDANLNSVMAAMGFKGYVLPEQYETTPLGGKLVWQKWHDDILNRDFLKVDFVYQSIDQLKDGAKLTLENPPLWKKLEIKACPVDENGFCPWEKFLKILSHL